MRSAPPLALEVVLARAVASLSRRLGAGGGTTIPGRLLTRLDPAAIDRLAARLTAGVAVASALLAAPRAELGLFEVDEGALPELLARLRPRGVCLGNLFRDQLDRYGELE